ncbi:effector-associated constant component EACC1 [Actinokineospora iranica]|uniref:Uncharacterized protein n=1 Tax=Actinokineospora iranica TaxID=1271860 RepID=A0A1G6TR58_9PSEU|nr:hypothetical protein [Actinokineospora iranica]SDD31521.1 hypothetical protein SAMN05216174_109273 [Actinokineospora iranica]
MDALLTVEDETGDAVGSLLAWLKLEDALRGRVRLRQAAPAPGQMGAISDTVTVAVGGGGAVTVLISSITTWLRNRRSDVTINLTIGKRKLIIDTKRVKADPDSVRLLIDTATEALRQEDPDATG